MDWREDLAEEIGQVICPLAPYGYVYCNKKCTECEYKIEFKKDLKEIVDDKNTNRQVK